MEVDRKFQQKKVFKKNRQTAASILGWIDAASTMGCVGYKIRILNRLYLTFDPLTSE